MNHNYGVISISYQSNDYFSPLLLFSLYCATNVYCVNVILLYSWIRLEARAVEMKKVYATLRVLIDVLEALVTDSSSDGMGKLIMEEVTSHVILL